MRFSILDAKQEGATGNNICFYKWKGCFWIDFGKSLGYMCLLLVFDELYGKTSIL